MKTGEKDAIKKFALKQVYKSGDLWKDTAMLAFNAAMHPKRTAESVVEVSGQVVDFLVYVNVFSFIHRKRTTGKWL